MCCTLKLKVVTIQCVCLKVFFLWKFDLMGHIWKRGEWEVFATRMWEIRNKKLECFLEELILLLLD